jgi:rhamnulokinase
MGLWIIQCLQKQTGLSFDEMVKAARQSGVFKTIDVNDPRFISPSDMRKEIAAALGGEMTDAVIINSVYHSLAASYGKAIKELEGSAGRVWDALYIAGGGAKNAYLSELTAKYTGKKVTALPIEAAALGNLKIQEAADGSL